MARLADPEIFYGFGSRVLVPGFGFVLQNRGAGFVLEPGHPNEFAPGKRPFHTIIPAALLGPDGRWEAVFGVTGGQYQPQGHVQVVVNLLDHGMGPQAVLDAPRYRLRGGRHGVARVAAGGAGRRVRRPGPAVVDDETTTATATSSSATPTAVLRRRDEPRRDGLAVGC